MENNQQKRVAIVTGSSSSSLLTARGAICPPERAMCTWTTIRRVKNKKSNKQVI